MDTPLLLFSQGTSALDLQWALGLYAPDPFFAVRIGRTFHVLASTLEAARFSDVLATAPRGHSGSVRIHSSAKLADFLKARRVTRVAVPDDFPLAEERRLRKAGIHVDLAPSPLFPKRGRKRPDEVDAIRAAQRAAVSAYRLACKLLRKATPSPSGLLKLDGKTFTSELLHEKLELHLLSLGYDAPGLIASVGPQTALPHHTGTGPIRLGDPVVLDIFPHHRQSGYWGDFTRTVVRGPVSPRLRKIHAAVASAQKLALELVRPGVSGPSIQKAVEEHFRSLGFPTNLSAPGRESGFIHSVGHGVGLDIHEEPRISKSGGILAAGHVVTVEPGLYYPGFGGVRIEDTVLVTPRGAEILVPCPHPLSL